MKLKWTLVALTTYCMLFCISSCESHEQTADDAFEQVKEEKLSSDSGETPELTLPTKAATRTTPPHHSPAKPDPWTQFKVAAESSMHANDTAIVTLKGLPNNGKHIKKVIELEKENNNLRVLIAAYEQDERARRDKFEAQIRLDVSGIATALVALRAAQ